MTTAEQNPSEQGDATSLDWGTDAPRGGRAVLARILKENATVPLFFGQTLIQSLRDVGYNHTTSALCEHVDNAIQSGATEIRVFFRQSGKKDDHRIDVAVYDNGPGMPPPVMKVATSFGGSTTFGNRERIGRFGMGMKTAALSMSPVMELFSWQEPGAIYNMTLDVDAIGKDRRNLIDLSDPVLLTELPDEVADLFRKPMAYPHDRQEQQLLGSNGDPFIERLGRSGTIVYMPQCDRLTFAKEKTLVDHAVKEMARVYRRSIGHGLRLLINNRQIDAFDPTYSMENARHMRIEGLLIQRSHLIVAKQAQIKVAGEHGSATAPIMIKLYKLPAEEWMSLPRKTQRNDLKVFDGNTVSILRNDREVFAGRMTWLTSLHNVTNWYRVEIDFPGVLDEAFGVAANKQGVRLKSYVQDAIKDAIGGEISTLNDELKRLQARLAATREPARASASEAKASDVDAFQQYPLFAQTTPEEEAQLDENLRGLALTLKREGETDDQAFERIKGSKYIIDFKHDEYWPFYEVKYRFGRVILTINSAHPFFAELYEPVRKLSAIPGGEDIEEIGVPTVSPSQGPVVALELLLLSLARTESRLSSTGEEARRLLDTLRREWSEAYRVQLSA
jgi:hypothetical protein